MATGREGDDKGYPTTEASGNLPTVDRVRELCNAVKPTLRAHDRGSDLAVVYDVDHYDQDYDGLTISQQATIGQRAVESVCLATPWSPIIGADRAGEQTMSHVQFEFWRDLGSGALGTTISYWQNTLKAGEVSAPNRGQRTHQRTYVDNKLESPDTDMHRALKAAEDLLGIVRPSDISLAAITPEK